MKQLQSEMYRNKPSLYGSTSRFLKGTTLSWLNHIVLQVSFWTSFSLGAGLDEAPRSMLGERHMGNQSAVHTGLWQPVCWAPLQTQKGKAGWRGA